VPDKPVGADSSEIEGAALESRVKVVQQNDVADEGQNEWRKRHQYPKG
jgi:hypothetical protein